MQLPVIWIYQYGKYIEITTENMKSLRSAFQQNDWIYPQNVYDHLKREMEPRRGPSVEEELLSAII